MASQQHQASGRKNLESIAAKWISIYAGAWSRYSCLTICNL